MEEQHIVMAGEVGGVPFSPFLLNLLSREGSAKEGTQMLQTHPGELGRRQQKWHRWRLRTGVLVPQERREEWGDPLGEEVGGDTRG